MITGKYFKYSVNGQNADKVKDSELVMEKVQRNKDYGNKTQKIWSETLKKLGGESENVKVYRFPHNACGWMEVIAVKPESEAARIALEIEHELK